MAWYDLDEAEKTESKKEYLARIKYDNIIFKKAKSFMDIVDGELLDGVQYRIITEQGFNAITVIKYLSEMYALTDIYIAVYRMNEKAVQKLIDFIERDGININIVLSSFFRENKRYEKWCHDLISFSENRKHVKVTFAWSHAKVFLAKTTDNKHIVFEGSGNLSDNARIEQYIIENNKKSYEFHRQWISEILNAE